MAGDNESQLYRDMADVLEELPKLRSEIKSLKNENKALKTSITRLSKRIQSQELMDFQEQITRLNERIEEVKKASRFTDIALAHLWVDHLQLNLKQAIHLHLEGHSFTKVREILALKLGEAREAIERSPEPLAIAVKFKVDCEKMSKDYNLKAFVEG